MYDDFLTSSLARLPNPKETLSTAPPPLAAATMPGMAPNSVEVAWL